MINKITFCIKLICIILFPLFSFSQDIDSLINIIEENKTNTTLIDKANNLINEETETNTSLAMLHIKKIQSICIENKYTKGLLISNNIIGNIYAAQGRNIEALKIFLNNYNQCEIGNYEKIKGNTLHNLGNFYLSLKKDSLAIVFFNQAMLIYRKIKDTNGIADIYSNLGNVYQIYSNLSKSIDCYKKAIQFYIQLNDNNNLSSTYNNLSLAYYILKDYKNYELYLNKSQELNKKEKKYSGMSFYYSIQAYYKLERKEFLKSKKYLDSALLYSTKSGSLHLLPSIYKSYSELDSILGNFESSLFYYKKHIEIKDSISNTNKINEINKLQRNFDFALKEKEVNIYKTTISKQKIKISILVIFVSFILIIVIILVYFILKIRKSSFKIKEQQQIITNQTNELYANKIHSFTDKIESQKRELTTNALFLIEANEKLANLIDEINLIIKKQGKNQMKEVEFILKKYKFNRNSTFWEDFEVSFEQVHTSFYKNIAEKCPDLSPAEIKLCALLKLNMSTKEIMAITSSTENSINVARSKIRTKFGLKRDENLLTFFSQF